MSWPIKKRKEMGKLFLYIWEYGKKKNATDVRTMNPDLPHVKKTKKVERNIRETRVALKRGGSDGTKKRKLISWMKDAGEEKANGGGRSERKKEMLLP